MGFIYHRNALIVYALTYDYSFGEPDGLEEFVDKNEELLAEKKDLSAP